MLRYSATKSAPDDAERWAPLPEVAAPVHYDIHWRKQSTIHTLYGRMALLFSYTSPSIDCAQHEVVLHASGLEYSDYSLVAVEEGEEALSSPLPAPVVPLVGDESEDSCEGTASCSSDIEGANRGDAVPNQSAPEASAPGCSSSSDPNSEFLVVTHFEVVDDPAREIWRLRFETNRALPKGQEVMLRFFVSLQTPISSYKVADDGDRRTGVMMWDEEDQDSIVTYLEPTHARKLYPCFDEPRFRATYQVSVTCPSKLVCRSATPVESEASLFGMDRGSKTLRFEKTISLPSYLISFALGPFQCLETETKRGVKCSVYFHQRHVAGEGYYALDLMSQAVQFFEEYFQFPLPLKKLDLVAVDHFPVLGMENWGMIALLSSHMLVQDITSVERRRRIARLIGHEIVHQWFGDIVNLNGWRYIWLKEGMARYLEFVFVQHTKSKWHIWADFLSTVQTVALTEDANASPDSAHAVEAEPPLNPRHVFDLFDVISYGKAASIIRMIAGAMGDDRFVTALRTFFKENAMKSVSSDVLYDCLARQLPPPSSLSSAPSFAEKVAKWVQTVGHPYVYVEKVGDHLRISQYEMPQKIEGFLARLRPLSASTSGTPIVPGSSGGTPRLPTLMSPRGSSPGVGSLKGQSLALNPKDPLNPLTPSEFWVPLRITEIAQGQTSATRQLELEGPVSSFACNSYAWIHSGGFGTFHADYDVASWDRIFEVFPFFGALDRLTICSSVLELRTLHIGVFSLDGHDRCIILLKLFQAVAEKKERHNWVWSYLAGQLLPLASILRPTAAWSVFRPLLLHMVQHLIDDGSVSFWAKGTDSVDASSTELINSTIDQLLAVCTFTQSPTILTEAREYFQVALSLVCDQFETPANRDGVTLDSLQQSRLCAAFEAMAMHGEEEDWNAMVACHAWYCAGGQSRATRSGTDSPTRVATTEGQMDPSREGDMTASYTFHESLQLPMSFRCALLTGILARESADALNYQQYAVSLYTGLGPATVCAANNNKLLSALIDNHVSGSAPLHKNCLRSVLGMAKSLCSSAVIASQLQSAASSSPSEASEDTELMTSTHRAIELNSIWTDYVCDHYMQHLDHYHRRTVSGVSGNSLDGPGSDNCLGT